MEFQKVLTSRRSTRKFKPLPVEREMLEKIVEAGRCAPSGGNAQTCHFTVLTNPALLQKTAETVREVFAGMEYDENTCSSVVRSIQLSKKGTYVYHYGAPALLLVSNRKGYDNAMADSACAMENMMLQCAELSLANCWINQLHRLESHPAVGALIRDLGIKENETVCGALAVGYANTENGLPLTEPLKRTGNPVTWLE